MLQAFSRIFNRKSKTIAPEPEQVLESLGVEFKRQPDGSIMVPGSLDLSNKGLAELPDLSNVTVGGDFYCYSNELTSLEHSPQTVGGGFYCYSNNLTSLKGAPQHVGGVFSCVGNQLNSLEHAPEIFDMLGTDLGNFKSWDEVPEELRMYPETKANLEKDRLMQEQVLIHVATVLQSPMEIGSPLKLRKSAPSKLTNLPSVARPQGMAVRA